jgi:hypothetical protein
VNSRPRIDVTRWSHNPREAVKKEVGRWRRGSSGTLGLIGTLLVHAIAFQSVLLGTRVHTVRLPDTQGPGATLIQSTRDPAEALILIELPSADMKATPLFEDLASAGFAPKNLLVTMISPDPLPHVEVPVERLDEKSDTEASVDSGDPAGRALLFGRYSGQIQARVERAWRRPRTPVSEVTNRSSQAGSTVAGGSSVGDHFRCQVRILQDAHGAVQEVQMIDCNGSVTWQQSLVTAILGASPLPAPPSPTVFTRSLTMTFEGEGYAPGSSEDGYDIE